jgi:HEAT repeat protein
MRALNYSRCLLLVFAVVFASGAFAVDSAIIDRLLSAKDIDVQAIRALGESVMPQLVDRYRQTDDKLKRARIAWVFYQLSWKSEAAKEAMLQDIHTSDRDLRLQVQWALGRVSSDDRIVDVLLQTMHADDNVLFREKAACALASDQIHLTPQQHYKLVAGLIQLLGDPKIDVRSNATLALRIQTGQTKGFDANASESVRNTKIGEWQIWLAEYKSQL